MAADHLDEDPETLEVADDVLTAGGVLERFVAQVAHLVEEAHERVVLGVADPLEAEVDIQVRPGGKKLQNIKLLSGGERALTALSLLFAVYLVKPSPFCILDEVDAMLDEVNVGRFRQALRELTTHTQTIVITHNRGTIQAAWSW